VIFATGFLLLAICFSSNALEVAIEEKQIATGKKHLMVFPIYYTLDFFQEKNNALEYIF